MEPSGRSSQHPGTESERGRPPSAGHRGVPLGALSRALRHSREAQVYQGLPR